MRPRPSSTYPFRPIRTRRRLRAATAAAVTLVLALGFGQAPAVAKPAPYTPPAVKDVPSVPVTTVKAETAPAAVVPSALDAPAPVWPSAGTAEVTLPAAADQRATARGPARAGTLPVLVDHPGIGKTAPARVTVHVYDRAATARAGVDGLLLRVSPTSAPAAGGQAAVTVDYRAFRTAYGASWASRLRMYQLPECALATPEKPACAPQPVPSSRNHAGSSLVTATIPAASTTGSLLALDADPSGPSGDFTATALQPSSTWSAGGNSGAFTWAYPMRVPPVPGGLAPSVALNYNSQAVDGRHAASNNQPAWAGGGFDAWPGGYIERGYRSCSDDMDDGGPNDTAPNNTVKTGDLCWANYNAVLNLNGTSSELIYNSTEGRWHLRNDDGSRVRRETGADNGDNDGEYWVVTSTSGTQYWFGKHKLPGWASGNPVTNSTWTTPVFGNHDDEPCHATTYANSDCVQAWRWNLDYVVDLHGNSASYWYTAETNKYGRNNTPADDIGYSRGGYLTQIAYGTRRETETSPDTVFAGTATAKVVFGTTDRCLTSCATHDGTHWPDTPWDLECAATATSCDTVSPTFWSTRRLATITTQIRNSGGGYDNVERWTLTHGFPDPGDTTQAGLWLEKISHTGLVGGTASLPDVTFTSLSLDNRVDGIDNIAAMAWHRLVRIDTETGGAISIVYSDADCTDGGAEPAVHNNDRRCYPVKWIPDGQTTPITDWFHKYVVEQVRETDMVAGASHTLTRYSYLDSPAWHYNDDDGIIKPAYKTWSGWRGYARVGVTTGDPDRGDPLTYAETRYFRGMHGDKQPSGTRTVNITDSKGGTWPDEDWFAGMTREQITFNGPGGPEVSGTINDPWASGPTATRTINTDTVTARFTNTATVKNRVALDAGRGERVTRTTTTFDGFGMPIQVDDFGQDGVAGDEQCAKTTYEPRNTTAWLLTAVHRGQVFAVSCTAAGTPTSLVDADVISDTKTTYDNAPAHGTAPSKANPTKVEEMTAWNAGTPTYVTTTQATYDAHGRVTQTIDANTNATDTAYTPATGGPVTAVKVTNAADHETVTELSPAWGSTTAVVDPNLKRTDLAYDPLGRLIAVWKPGRTKDVHTANAVYSYTISKTAPSVVTTKVLGPNGNDPGMPGNYVTSHTLYDGLLRQVQTQAASPAAAGGRLLTNTFYDTAGREKVTYSAYYNATALPATTPTLQVPVQPLDVPTQNRAVYDGAGRAVAHIFEPYNVERWRTTTYYAGDRTDITPPVGGTGTSTVTDARGRTTQLWQYPRLTAWNSGDVTTYSYNRKGQLIGVTDPASNAWTYEYNIRGFKTVEIDPDRGRTTSTYDAGGRLSTTVDARNIKLVYKYDAINRTIGVYQNFALGVPRAAWSYDLTAKGQLYASVRSGSGGVAYETRISDYSDDYQPEAMQVVIPDTETGLAGTYQYQYTYNPNGSLATTSFIQAAGTDLPTETLHHEYTDLGLPTALTTTYGLTHLDYVNATHYDDLGQVEQHNLCTNQCDQVGHNTHLTYNRELETGRVTQNIVSRDTAAPYNLADVNYSYDHAGNITKIRDAIGTPDNQCFTYDHLRRLTQAWTPASDNCTTTPTTAGLGGPAPYWLTWTINKIGNRTEQVDHRSTGNITTSYTHPTSGPTANKPHAVSTITTGSTTSSYTYDNTGNTLTRPANGGTQTLTWDQEGKLATTSDPSGASSYLYDAGGNRLIRRDATGKTLYLPGQEIRYTTSAATKTVTRYYSHAGATVASRTATGLSWLVTDHQATNLISINTASNAVSQRRQTPFGTPRGTVPTSWPNPKGYVGGENDPTGLVHLGAREYDPTTGRFISVDPIMDLANPQQWNAYAYANNTPVTSSDPTGLCLTQSTCDDRQLERPPRQCGSANACEGPPTIDDVLDMPNDIGDDHAYSLDVRGYTGSKAFTNRELLEFSGQYPDNWAYVCTWIYQLGDWDHCANNNPFLPERSALENFLLVGTIVLGMSCALTPGCWVAAVAGTGEFYATGSLLGAAGVGALTGYVRPGVVGAGGACSFSGDTEVLMADGTTKPIRDIRVGDEVLATDPETDEQGPRTVTYLWVHEDQLVALELANGEVLTTTEDHPFWNETAKQWQQAQQLSPGDHLYTGNGAPAAVDGISWTSAHVGGAYTLSVDDIHTYYVIAGDTPVLVHNCPPAPGGGSGFTWPRQQGGNCHECATRIQGRIGGDIVHITPRGAPRLGASTHDPNGTWFEHYAVVKDGRVYDGTTGSSGLAPSQYKAQWGENAPYINFGF
ncbi:polymorphic toxin-type HINT domain-containing protein [Phytohabitans rumicis]|uniref:Type IV secretion protein Rhs n=1 Tax=Phytohabitans rumicis TaxID=1076125 RepID=A0A6V8KR11_9ACTN|nr:polymorphic toxin-type HINT domain-containing protein [Phytohabitans rumicis]GFJ87602.1 type IV secretion protein Rhs [Phytohabitans rumicis]